MSARRPLLLAVTLPLVTGLLGLLAAPAAAVATAAPAVPKDCSRDVTAELQAWIDATPDASTLTLAPSACYRVDGTLTMSGRHDLTLEGSGATLRQVTDGSERLNPKYVRTREMLRVGMSTGIVVRNLTLRGANPYAGRGELAYRAKFEAQHGLAVMGVQRMLVDHLQIYDVYGDFVWVGPGTSDLTVRNSTFLRNGRQGWTINGTNILFEHNLIGETRRATIDMEPSSPTWASHNVTIQDNEIGKGRLLFFSSVGAGNAPIDGINILRNRLHRPMQIFVASGGLTRSHYRIVGNVSDAIVSGFGSAIVFRNVSDVVVADNYQRLQWSHALFGVGAFMVQHLTVTGNTFPAADGVIRDRGANVDVRQSSNRIGSPLVTLPPSVTAGPTPALVP